MLHRRIEWHRAGRLGIAAVLTAWIAAGCMSSRSVELGGNTHQPDPAGRACGPQNSITKSSAIVLASHDVTRGSLPLPGTGVRGQERAATGPQTLPIDLPTALRLGHANNLEIALACEQINAALARLEGTEVLWLPSLTAGTTYLRHDGTIQRSSGEVFDARRSSLFVGGGPVLAVDLADAIYEPLVAQQVLRAEQAAANVATNDTLLHIAEDYLDLLAAQESIAIAQETQEHAAELARLTAEFAKEGAGLPSDAARAQTELGQCEQQTIFTKERVVVASAALAQLLRLDPQVQLTPLDPNVAAIELVPEDRPLADLVAHALSLVGRSLQSRRRWSRPASNACAKRGTAR